MKNFLFALVILCLPFLSQAQLNLKIEPARPRPGGVITIKYDPKNTVLQDVKDPEAYAYLLEGKLPMVQEINLNREGEVYLGKIKTNDSTKAVFISFSKDQQRDNNEDKGYYSMLYDEKGNELPGANIALAAAFNNYAGIWGMKRNAAKARELSAKEFSSPLAREKFHNDYFAFLGQSTEASDKEVLKQELQKQLNNESLDEADLMRIKGYYETTLKDKEKGDEVYAIIKQKFPNGRWKRTEFFTAFNKEKDPEAKERLFEDFIASYSPLSKEDQPFADQMAFNLAAGLADSSDFAGMKKYAAYIKSTSALANLYNNVAWQLAGEGIGNKPIDVQTGLELSQESLALLKKDMKNDEARPSYLTKKQWAKNLDNQYYTFADTYATLLYQNKDYNKAYEIEKKVVENYEGKNMNFNEAYSLLTEKVKGAKEAQAELEKFYREGKYTAGMKAQLKSIYLGQNHTEEDWNKYSADLEQFAFNNLKKDLLKQMINMPAPQFKLKDLSGNEVSLASLKGKVVIIDFWATWCGPCKASFPGMKLAVEKYKDNPDVVFLFIDTWESGDDRQKKVTEFMDKTKYPFLVLYDEAKKDNADEFTVVADYKVDGIPTKFIIDKNNNIRFKAVGYQGSTDALVNEITAMIDMAAEANDGPAKKSF